MQKKLIALAIAGLATAPAFAQTNVTIYGVADLTLENSRANGAANGNDFNIASKQRVTSNSSLLGFRGVEALGNGLDAIFQFETGVVADGSSTSGPFGSTRDTFVGLRGGFGTLKLGNNTSPFRKLGNDVDLTPGGNVGIGASNNLLGRVQTTAANHNTGFTTRLANSVKYDSPNFSGFSVAAIYGANENKANPNTSNTNNNSYGLGVGYAAGPFLVGYAYEQRHDNNASTLSGDEKSTGHRLGGTASFGAFKLAAIWDRQEVKVDSVGGAPNTDLKVKRDAWMIGGQGDFGPSQVYLMYVDARKAKVSGSLSSGVTGDNTKAKEWTLGYNYNLSKRTMLKTYYSQIRNDSRAWYDYTETTSLGLTSANRGADPRTFGVGFRHLF